MPCTRLEMCYPLWQHAASMLSCLLQERHHKAGTFILRSCLAEDILAAESTCPHNLPHDVKLSHQSGKAAHACCTSSRFNTLAVERSEKADAVLHSCWQGLLRSRVHNSHVLTRV